MLDRLTDDVVWTTPYPPQIVPHGGSRTGKDGVRLFFEQLARGYEITKFDPREFIASGDDVVALVTIAGHARETGVAAAGETAHVFPIRNGKVSDFVSTPTRAPLWPRTPRKRSKQTPEEGWLSDARIRSQSLGLSGVRRRSERRERLRWERSAMKNDEYRFTTHWRVPGTCERISDVLADTDRIASWWPSVYRECTVLERGGLHGLGRRVAVTTKGFLPYVIRWRFTVVEEFYPHGSRIVADGDLEGEGRWTLRQDGDEVDITYDWRVRANKPLLLRFGRWLRPLFAANHNYTMRQGLRGLRAEIQTCA